MITDELTWKPVAPLASPQSSFITSTIIGEAICDGSSQFWSLGIFRNSCHK